MRRCPSLLLFAIGLGGCGGNDIRVCTTIGCTSSLTVLIAGTDDILPTGIYRVEATTDDADSTCTFTVNGGGEVEDVDFGVCTVARASGGRLQLTLPPLTGRVRIDVERDDVLVARRAVKPTYQGRYPNGPDCGEVCRDANVEVGI